MDSSPRLKGRYALKEVLGQGGMGVVYRAYDAILKCDVVVKTIRDAVGPAAVELFQRECEVLVALNHPNIIPILDIGQFAEAGQSKPFFVMPLLPGRTLDALIRDSTKELSPQRCADIISQVCRGLHAAHERGLVHRDIKPANIFVLPDFSVELIDFGVAHLVSMGNTGQKGTLFYMAPEVLQGQEPSALSDIFALGVTAYELFTRRRPFERGTEHELISAILHEIPPPASDLNGSIAQAVSQVLHKAMAKQPWHRFSNAREFAECLGMATRGEPIEMFNPARIRPRVDRARTAFGQGDHQFALEILTELEAEGHMEPDLVLLRKEIDVAARQKRIRQLLDSALTRLESDEYPLALQKIQEALSLDPGSAEAAALKARVESTRSERQIDGWLQLARQHLENNAFEHAREALANVVKIRPQGSRVSGLLAEIDRREREHMRIRQQKQQLYLGAVEAHQKGEISSAMTMLEKVLELDQRAPDTTQPERSAAYQNFYNQVRSAHDSIKSAYAEACKFRDEQRFDEALAVCDQYLLKYPGHALFQALKFDVEEQQRLQNSGFVADIDRRVEAEVDLEKKIEILQEALDRLPDEPRFRHALHLAKERLELVNSIVAKARHYEQQSRFSEAVDQWEILRTIYGRYPGLAIEIERLRKRREQQATLEARARWLTEINHQIQAGDYARAQSLCQGALVEFPGDGEFTELENLTRQSEERCAEAQRLLGQAEQQFGLGAHGEGLETLRRSQQLDPRNPGIRAALVERLIEQARSLMDSDWRSARVLILEASDLDAASASAMLRVFEDRERDERANEAAPGARQCEAGEGLANAVQPATPPSPPPGGPVERIGTPSAAARPPARSERPRLAGLAVTAVVVLVFGSAVWFACLRRKPVPPAASPPVSAPVQEARPEAGESGAPSSSAALGILRIEVSPPTAAVSFRRPEEVASRPFHLPSMEVEGGRYVISVSASGYATAARTIDVKAGETQSLAFRLTPANTSGEPARPRSMNPNDWDKEWTRSGEWFMRQGAGFTLYSASPSAGTYQFTIRPRDTRNPLAKPKVSWVADYVDPRNYVLFELDSQSYSRTDYRDGRRIVGVAKRPHGVKAGAYSFRFYVEPQRLVVMLMADNREYRTLDEWSEAGRVFGKGHFGFYCSGSDQVWLANFTYFPAQAAGGR
ncbi:MAG: protein kinase [Bryobacteraceae bacterium]